MGNFRVPTPKNEPVLNYAPGSPERAALDKALKELKANPVEIPLVIDGQDVKSDKKIPISAPHDHKLNLGYYYQGGPSDVKKAVESALEAQKTWEHVPWEHRAAIFLKAADLLTGPYRHIMNAATMLAHSKNIYQAEIDAVCELADFFRFNAYYLQSIYDIQPGVAPLIWNRMDHRPLEGFVFAVTPFNFVSINGNLPTAPAMAGNVVVWKPASTAAYTSHFFMKILREAGLPAGVINLFFARAPISATRCSATGTSPAYTSPDPPPSSRICGGRSARISPIIALIRASSAKPAARISSSRTPRPIRKR